MEPSTPAAIQLLNIHNSALSLKTLSMHCNSNRLFVATSWKYRSRFLEVEEKSIELQPSLLSYRLGSVVSYFSKKPVKESINQETFSIPVDATSGTESVF